MTLEMSKSGSLFYQAKFVDVNGIRTRYYELGQGEPMLLVHGGEWNGRSSANTWVLNLGGLAQNFHVYAPDKLGCGMTDNPKSDDQYTSQAVGQHIFDFIRIMGLKSVHLIGQSRGGAVAVQLAREHPELAKTLVIVNSGTLAPEVGDDTTSERYRQIFFENPLPDPKNDMREYIRQWTGRLSYNPRHLTDEHVEALAFMEVQPKAQEAKRKIDLLSPDISYCSPTGTPTEITKQWMHSIGVEKGKSLRWIKEGGLQIPTFVYWGANDPLAILAQGLAVFDLIREHTPRAHMHIFNQAGHAHYQEYSEEWNRVVTNFIQSS